MTTPPEYRTGVARQVRTELSRRAAQNKHQSLHLLMVGTEDSTQEVS